MHPDEMPVAAPSNDDDARVVNWPEFQKELASLLNRYSLEKPSDTPDFVLAEYLTQCLVAYNVASESKRNFFK